MHVNLWSFGEKHGPLLTRCNEVGTVDLIMDVQDMPNPHKHAVLKKYNGTDACVQTFVMAVGNVRSRLDKIEDFLDMMTDGTITIGVRCFGGRHRSVAFVELLAARLRNKGVEVVVHHRDVNIMYKDYNQWRDA